MSSRGDRSERRAVFAYSPDRRTAVVLSGTGAHGAYHAGVLRALQEAGVKIDLLAGRGIGAATAVLAAIDGGARLWEADGIWRSSAVRRLYGWRSPLKTLAGLGISAVLLLFAGLAGLASGATALGWGAVLAAALALMGAVATMAAAARPGIRRTRGAWWWRLFGAPVEAESARRLFAAAIWSLIRGADPVAEPTPAVLSRRLADVLGENLGQPGFRELVLVATDLDSRRDVVAALLKEPFRHGFFSPRSERDRRSDVLDVSGPGRDHAIDIMAAAATPPNACEAHLVTFAPDSFWRGETHRLCDRPASIARLLEEVAAAGATQVIVVSAVASAPAPHQLRASRVEWRHRIGEYLDADEAAALRDALEMARLRYDSVYVIAPAHNPIGPFDFNGAYDDASDRHQELGELMERAYEDAYRQFIEPVVGASGEQLARTDAGR